MEEMNPLKRRSRPRGYRPGIYRYHHSSTATKTGIFIVAALLSSLYGARDAASAQHDPREVRLYLDVDGVVYQHKHGPLTLKIRPWGRSEERFRTEGLVYLKSFLGLRLDILPWVMFQTYYAHKDMLYSNKPRKQAHLGVFDSVFHLTLGPLRLLDRNGFEFHITDAFFRYRNYLEARLMLPWEHLRWLGIFLSGELRVDSDAGRLNMLDLRTGLWIHLSKHFFSKVYYYLEDKRRNLTRWQRTHSLSLFLAIRI